MIAFARTMLLGIAASIAATGAFAEEGGLARIAPDVDRLAQSLMKEHAIPGMAIAVTAGGERRVFNYGKVSVANGQKIGDATLFEIGSISKIFTALMASYAQAQGRLSLSDAASKYQPALKGSSFDGISLLNLGTYTAGGLPLQLPDSVKNLDSMLAYFKSWRGAYAPGSHRHYSNASLGLFGYLAAESMGAPIETVMEEKIFPALGLTRTFIRVPKDEMKNYAYGTSKTGKPIRVTPAVFDAQTYGVKTTASDLIRFVETNIDPAAMDNVMRRAIATTQTGYFRLGGMVQGLGWEMYPYPVELDALLAGNSNQVIFEPDPVTQLSPPLSPDANMLINKTGSTNGFGAYAAFVPAKRIGIVLLANRNCPIPARVKTAHEILTALAAMSGESR